MSDHWVNFWASATARAI